MRITKIHLAAALALGSLLACGTAGFAQDATPSGTNQAGAAQPAGKKRGPGGIERLTIALSLTDEQKPKVEAALKEFREKQQELRKDTSLAQAERRTKFAALTEENDKVMKGILTPEQFDKYKAMRFGGRRGGKKADDQNKATNTQTQ